MKHQPALMPHARPSGLPPVPEATQKCYTFNGLTWFELIFFRLKRMV